jgi:hypothetical protein
VSLPPTETVERLAAAGIQLLPTSEIATHYVFERGGFVAMVERLGDGFGTVGSPGLLTERGFAALVWRQGKPWFVAKGHEYPAKDEQVEEVRRLAADLEAALR